MNKGKTRLTFRDKALLVIEAIAFDSTMEFLYLHPPEDKTAAQLLDKLNVIYRQVHVARNPSCIGSHGDWIREVNDTYKALHKAGVF